MLSQRWIGVFDEKPVSKETANDSLDEPVEQALEALGIRRTNGMESWSVGFLGVDAIQHEHVQMNVEIQCTAETLDQRDDAGGSTRVRISPRLGAPI